MKKNITNWLPDRWQRTTKVLTLAAALTSTGYLANAQCNWPSGVSLYGTGTASTTSCLPVTTGTSLCHYFTEYATFNGLVVGQSYTISVVNTTSIPGTYGLGVYTSTTTGTSPLASASSSTFPISVTFTATTTTVYTKSFQTACGSTGTSSEGCNNFTIQNSALPAATTAATSQSSSSSVAAGTLDAQIMRLDIPLCTNDIVTGITFATTGSTAPAADIARAKVYYTTSTTFSSAIPFGSPVANPSGSFTVTGSQAVPAGIGYFWLVYDVACGATVANVLDAEATSYTLAAGTPAVPTPANPTGTRAITAYIAPTAPSYSATATTNVSAGATNLAIGRTNISGNSCASTVTEVKFNTASSPAADLASAKCYYTTSTTFGTTVPFGTPVVAPNGDITFTGSKALASGSGNYFWLAYDVTCSATPGDSLVATPVSITADAVTSALTTPATNTKKGIVAAVIPSYTATTATSTGAGAVNLQMGYTNIAGTSCASTVTEVKFNTASSPVADLSNAKCYYTTSTTFGTTAPFGTPVVSPNGDITFTGSKALASGTGNYFWLTYDVACAATAGDSLVATPVSITTDAGTTTIATPATNAKKGVTGLYATTRTDGNAATAVNAGATDAPFVYANVTGSATCAGTVSQVNFTVSGTSTATDITRAECYYTTTSTFSNATPYGSAIANPAAGTISFTGSQALATGSNYFWLVYDLSCSAVTANTLNGDVVSVIVNAATITPTGTATAANAVSATAASFATVADGDWNNPTIWSCGSVPPTGTNDVTINHNVTVTTAGNTAGNVTIAAGKSLTISSGDLTMGASSTGAATGNSNKSLTDNGTLTITGGTLNLNGAFTLTSVGNFAMSGGTFNLDPNDGTAAGSATGETFYINAITTAAQLNVTGGNINFLDPPYVAAKRALSFNTSALDMAWGTGATLTLGGGDDVNTSNTSGFYIECNTGSGTLEIGNLIVNGGRFSAQRHASTNTSAIYITKAKNLTVNSGSELVVNSAVMAVTGNVVNNGVITVTSTSVDRGLAFVGDAQYVSSAVTLFNGSNAQSLTGTGYFKKATADADPTAQTGNLLTALSVWQTAVAPGITLGMPLTVTSQLRLNGGTINTTSTNILALGHGTSVPGSAAVLTPSAGTIYGNSSTAYTTTAAYAGGWVNGPFNRWVTATTTTGQQGILPVGLAAAKPAQILFTTAPTAGGYLTASWIDGADLGTISPALTEAAVTPNTIDKVTNAMWQISNGGTLTGGTYTATFTDPANSVVTDYANTTLVKRSNSASPWVIEGTHVATTGSNGAPTIKRSGLTTFSQFAIGGGGVVLPVDVTFTGSNAGSANNLRWTTSNEVNFSHFELQRSGDSKSFSKLATIDSKGITNGSDYSYTDQRPLEGKNYYRLNMVDNDGKSAFSAVVELVSQSGTGLAVSVHPNPVKQQLNVEITGTIDSKAFVQVLDITGKVLQTIPVSSHAVSVDMSNLPAGTYMVRYTDNSHNTVMKVSKN